MGNYTLRDGEKSPLHRYNFTGAHITHTHTRTRTHRHTQTHTLRVPGRIWCSDCTAGLSPADTGVLTLHFSPLYTLESFCQRLGDDGKRARVCSVCWGLSRVPVLPLCLFRTACPNARKRVTDRPIRERVVKSSLSFCEWESGMVPLCSACIGRWCRWSLVHTRSVFRYAAWDSPCLNWLRNCCLVFVSDGGLSDNEIMTSCVVLMMSYSWNYSGSIKSFWGDYACVLAVTQKRDELGFTTSYMSWLRHLSWDVWDNVMWRDDNLYDPTNAEAFYSSQYALAVMQTVWLIWTGPPFVRAWKKPFGVLHILGEKLTL